MKLVRSVLYLVVELEVVLDDSWFQVEQVYFGFTGGGDGGREGGRVGLFFSG